MGTQTLAELYQAIGDAGMIGQREFKDLLVYASGAGAPSDAPDRVGRFYFDTSNQHWYLAVDTDDAGGYIPFAHDGLSLAELAILNGATITTAELNILDGVGATAAEINNACDVSTRIVSIPDDTDTLSLTQALHANRIAYCLDASLAITLPEATGTGDVYTVVLGIQATAVTIVTADTANCSMRGMLNAYDTDSEATLPSYPAVAGDDTITLNGVATGGKIYDRFVFQDILTDVWLVSGQIALSGGSEVTPFSSAA